MRGPRRKSRVVSRGDGSSRLATRDSRLKRGRLSLLFVLLLIAGGAWAWQRHQRGIALEQALTEGRAALLNRIAAESTAAASVTPSSRRRRLLPRLTWATAGAAAALTGVFVAGNLSLNASMAYASDVLRAGAAEAGEYADLLPGSGEYLRATTHARWQICDTTGEQMDVVAG